MSAGGGVRAAVVALAVAGAAACGTGSPSRVHEVEIQAARFLPPTVAVAEGDTVRWVNRDLVPHTVTAEDGGWGSGALAPGEAFVLVVGRVEASRYICSYHPTMTGVLAMTR